MVKQKHFEYLHEGNEQGRVEDVQLKANKLTNCENLFISIALFEDIQLIAMLCKCQ